LKTRFAALSGFWKICGGLVAYFIKIEAIAIFGNSNDRRDPHARRWMVERMRTAVPSTIRSPCNTSFTMQPAVHHSARMRHFAHGKAALGRAKISRFDLP
jgi:hypothetical protein